MYCICFTERIRSSAYDVYLCNQCLTLLLLLIIDILYQHLNRKRDGCGFDSHSGDELSSFLHSVNKINETKNRRRNTKCLEDYAGHRKRNVLLLGVISLPAL